MEKETKMDIIELTRGHIGVIVMFFLMLSSVSAIYSGDSEIVNLTEEFDSYSIVGNSTPIYLEIVQEGLTANITINKYQQSDNFTIIFFNEKEGEIREVERIVYRGGGSSTKTEYVDKIVIQPKFYDRNITVYEDREVINEKTIYQDTGFKLWQIIMVFVAGFLLCFMLWYFYGNRD